MQSKSFIIYFREQNNKEIIEFTIQISQKKCKYMVLPECIVRSIGECTISTMYQRLSITVCTFVLTMYTNLKDAVHYLILRSSE